MGVFTNVGSHCIVWLLRWGGESLSVSAGRGKSEHHRAGRRVTPVQPEIHAGDAFQDALTDSATENKPSRFAIARRDKGEKVG